MAVGLSTTLALLLSRLEKYQGIAEEINRACAERNCPPAFDLKLPSAEDSEIRIRASQEYRFEGFGVVIGLPPKMSFWVHYMPSAGERVEIGRFLVPIGFGDIKKVKSEKTTANV